jgi:hypothetical protein
MLPIYSPDRMPYVLKEGRAVRTLAVRIGGILTELWEYKKGDAASYARLIKECGLPIGKMKIAGEAPFQATLSPMEVLVVAGAIEEWKTSLAAATKASQTPCVVVQVDRLVMKLYNTARRKSAYAEIIFAGLEAKTESASLSPMEATVLSGIVGMIAPNCGE